jgi:exodeoxyribonuclease V beta subunit
MTTPLQFALPLNEELDVFSCPLDGVRLVEASAGTGKTWAICGLVLRLLLERGLGVQQVLVVTFTEAATAELRERIRARLVEVQAALRAPAGHAGAGADPFVPRLLARLAAAPGADPAQLARRVELALQSFDEAAIHTIHGWCQRALADTPFSARVPMALEVVTDDSALRDAALKDAWRAEVSRAGLSPALAACLVRRQDGPAAWAETFRALLARPLAERLWPPAPDVDAAAPAIDALDAAHRRAALRWQAERAEIVATLDAGLDQLRKNIYHPAAVRAGAAALDRLLAGADALAELDREDKADLFGAERLAKATKAGCTTPRHAFFDELGEWLARRDELEPTLVLARKALLRRVLERAEQTLRQHKREAGLVGFDDMLRNLHQRLLDPGDPAAAEALAQALRARYPAALIDEFQDTDPLQFEIFSRLYAASRPPSPRERRAAAAHAAPPRPALFLVGDPKQAIYSFRNADLPTYLQARELAEARYSLTRNQRSTAPLIEGLNRLFTQHGQVFMQPGLDYLRVRPGERARAPLDDRSLPHAPERHAALQLWTLPGAAEGESAPTREACHARTLEATAREIARLLGEARAGRVRLGGRALGAGDIAVLVRSHRQGAEVRQALAQHGVASVELSQSSVHHAPEAEELARVLAAVLQPAREGLLRAALATEVFGQGAAALAAADADAGALLAVQARFATYRTLWQQRGIAVMLREMLRAESIARRLLALPQGERRLTNWLHLTEALHEAEALHDTPRALWRWFERRRTEAGLDEAAQLRLESDRHLVQIVTTHRAKGLEYPVVFCPFLWGAQRPVRLVGDVAACHATAADGREVMQLDFRLGTPAAADEAGLRERIAHEEAAETLRLAYVALTRAIHRCVLVIAPAGPTQRGGRSPAHALRTPLNWLVAGGGVAPAAWLGNAALEVDAARVRAAWQRVAAPAPGDAADIPPVALTAIDAVLATALPDDAPPPAPPAALRALDPPRHVPAGWRVGSYSGLVRSPDGPAPTEATDPAAADHDALSAAAEPDADGWSVAGDGAGGAIEDDGPIADGTGSAQASAHIGSPAAAATPAALRVTTGSGAAGTPAATPMTDASSDEPAWAVGAVPGPGAAPLAPDDVLHFPRGPAAGDCIHAVFEHADFQRPAGWPAAAEAALGLLPAGLVAADPAGPAALSAMLQRMLREVCDTAIAPGLRLRDLPPERRLNELEFHLGAPSLSAAALQAGLARLGYPTPPLGFGHLGGYLRGYIDLVFEHGGRSYLLDWKSNHLGDEAAAYRPEACARAMARHGYHLQGLVYALALHRLLALRRPGYRHERDFGGVFYLFVRGVRPGWTDEHGRPCGVHFHRPPLATLDAFARLLEGGAVSPRGAAPAP